MMRVIFVGWFLVLKMEQMGSQDGLLLKVNSRRPKEMLFYVVLGVYAMNSVCRVFSGLHTVILFTLVHIRLGFQFSQGL